MSNIHYSEGEFPVNIYGPDYRCRHGYTWGMFSGAQWAPNTCKPCCPNDSQVQLLITDIGVEELKTYKLTITYLSGEQKELTLEIGKKYIVKYVEGGSLVTVSGYLTAMGAINSLAVNNSSCPCAMSKDYILQLDCSTEGHSSILSIRTSDIRFITDYVDNFGEDTILENATVFGATTFGTFSYVIITDATIDGDGNITKGTIQHAELLENSSIGIGGCAKGKNNLNHTIVTINSTSYNGIVSDGTVLSGRVYAPIVTGGKNGNGVVIGATVKADKAKLVIIDSILNNTKNVNGTLLNPVIENSIVDGGTRSGEDMVTVGSTVFGTNAYGGGVTGGTLYGGTATGSIDGAPYTIINGETTGGTTMHGIVEGGKIVGGKNIGNSIVGAIVYNGTCTKGYTVDGITTLGENGYIKPGYSTIPSNLTNPRMDCGKFIDKDIDELVIWYKNNTLQTNLKDYRGK